MPPVEKLRALPAAQREYEVLDQDVRWLSALRQATLNLLGRCSFRSTLPGRGRLRPLREAADAAGARDEEAGMFSVPAQHCVVVQTHFRK